MDYQEKLRLAKEALDSGFYDKETIEYIFPELKESEDDKIRKRIIEFLSTPFVKKGMSEGALSTWLAWLEKQGEKVDAIENLDTEFEKQVSHLIASAINKEHEYNEDFVKWTANALLNYAKHELEKQGKQKPADKIQFGKNYKCIASPRYSTFMIGKIYKPEDKFLCSLMNLCSNCFEPIEDGEQKSTDKVEPKFKVGDWIYHKKSGNTFYINKIGNGLYVSDIGATISLGRQNDWRLWTIKDAKDGDVLASDGGNVCLFDGTVEEGIYPFAYCGITRHGFEFYDRKLPFTHDYVYPANELQRDLLFQKIKEAGYEWDAEKKELKKIEQEATCKSDNSYTHVIFPFKAKVKSTGKIVTINGGKLSFDGEEWIKYQSNSEDEFKVYEPNDLELVCEIEYKSTWSEEDERLQQCLIEDQEKCLEEVRNNKVGHSEIISDLKEMYCERIDWLKSLKERMKGE